MTAWKSQLWCGMTYSDNVKVQRYDMIRLHMTPFVDGTVENKGKHMPNDLIHRKKKNTTQATRLALTNTSPSPFRGKLEGGPHAS